MYNCKLCLNGKTDQNMRSKTKKKAHTSHSHQIQNKTEQNRKTIYIARLTETFKMVS